MAIVKSSVYFAVCYCVFYIQWNLDLMKGQLQGTDEICSIFIYFIIIKEKKIVRYIEVFVKQRLLKSRFQKKVMNVRVLTLLAI